ncbi:hypothetical protein ACGH7X_35345 [Streptomyces sp. BBFR51]|uniref:hypothetical protein n=1 Tax=Streptomyces sp. BBFR51 TaxID=3372856 RepID=UPI0037DBFE2B
MSSADSGDRHAWWRTPRPVTGAVAGAATTAVAYFVSLEVLGHAEASRHVRPLPVSAERLLPYGIALGERLVSAGQDAAHVLERINTLAPWPLVALGLLRLARRDQALYVRFASALVLCSAAHLVVFVAGWGAPVRELPLVHGYWTLPAVRAGWFVLLALTAAATTARAWPRAAVTLVATVEVAVVVQGTDRQLLAFLSAAVVPVAAWYSAGRLRHRDTKAPDTTPTEVFTK